MTRTPRSFTIITALAGLALAAAACVAPLPAPAPATSPAPTAEVAPVTAAAPAPVPAATTAAPAAAAPAGTVVPGTLTSYKTQLEYKQEVVQPAPASVQTWVTMTVRYQALPAPGLYALDMTDKTGGASQTGPGSMQVIIAGADSYILTPQQGGKWLKVPIEQSAEPAAISALLDPNKLRQDTPAALLGKDNLVNAHETVAGEDTAHYRVKDAALASLLAEEIGDGKLAGGQADFWLSNAGGYVKQYQLDATVTTADNRRLHEAGKMLVTSANGPVQIATPAPDQVTSADIFNQAAGESAGATVLPNGSRISQAGKDALAAVPAPPQSKPTADKDLSAPVRAALPNFTMQGLPSAVYFSTAKPDALLNFYKTELAKQGWEEVETESGTTLAQPAMGTFAKGPLSLTLTVLPDAAKKANVVYLQVEG